MFLTGVKAVDWDTMLYPSLLYITCKDGVQDNQHLTVRYQGSNAADAIKALSYCRALVLNSDGRPMTTSSMICNVRQTLVLVVANFLNSSLYRT